MGSDTDIFEKFERESRYTQELSDEYHRLGYWADVSCADYLRQNATEAGDRLAVVDDERSVTWEELEEEALEVAAGLQSLEIERGDKVAYQIPNQIEWFAVRLGIALAGGIAVTLVPRFRAREVEEILEETEPKAYVGNLDYKDYDHRATITRYSGESDSMEHVVGLGPESSAETTTLEQIRTVPDGDFEPDTIHPDYPDTLSTTSGTTGRPKVFYQQQNARLAQKRSLVERCGLTKYDTILVIAPIQQGTGEGMAYYVPLVIGATAVVSKTSHPEEIRGLVDDREPSAICAIPTQMTKIENHSEPIGSGLATTRAIFSAGAPLPEKTSRYFEELGVKSVNFYGSSEAGGVAAVCPVDDGDIRHNTAGKELNISNVKIIDGDGNEQPPGETGEIIWKGGTQCVGYYDDYEATRDILDLGGEWSGWYHSSDAGTIDRYGNIRVMGRMDDMIIRGGQNIHPTEVEELIQEIEYVKEAAIVPMPDPEYNQRACAYLSVSESTLEGGSPTLEEITDFLDSKGFAKYKWPERIELIENMPRAPGGKIDKKELKADIREKVERERDR